MKKFLSLALAICLVLSSLLAVSCAKEKTAEELVESALEEFSKQDAYQVDVDYKILMTVQGMTLDIPANVTIKLRGAQSDSPIYDMTMTAEMLGQLLDMHMYLEDEWAYYDMLGMSYKQRVETIDESSMSGPVDGLLGESVKELLINAELTREEDGSARVFLCVDAEALEILADFPKDIIESILGEGGDVSIGEMHLTYFFDKDDVLTGANVYCDLNMTVEGIEVEASADLDMTFTAYGDDVVITPPEGYLDYEEMTLE